VQAPTIQAPLASQVVSAVHTTLDGTGILQSYFGRYPNWTGLPAGERARVRITVQLPAGASGAQRIVLSTPASSDPDSSNNTVTVTTLVQ
jgi:hypothetical protein